MSEFMGGDSDKASAAADSGDVGKASAVAASGEVGVANTAANSSGSGNSGGDTNAVNNPDGKSGFSGEKPRVEPPEKPGGSDSGGSMDASGGGKPSGQPPQGDSGGGKGGEMQGGGEGGGSGDMGSGGGANLNYVDDSLDSYDAIWEGSVFNTTDKDHSRVVKALKKICGEDADTNTLAKYMDVDNVLRYMAVHTFVVNLDSLSGNMAHNYYLYESDSQLNIIPWDYNLAFGGFQSAGSSDVINFPIDTPFTSAVSTEDRQFFMSLLSNEEYLAQYHEYLRQLAEEYVGGGAFENTVSRITSQIDDLIETDPTAFYSYDEYTAAASMLKETVSLRAESVLGQLDGTIPSTRSGQEEDSSALIDASSIDLTVMGVMNGGGGGSGGGEGGGPGGNSNGDSGTAPSSGSNQDPGGGDREGSMQPPGGEANGNAGEAPSGSSDENAGEASKGSSEQPTGGDSGGSADTN